MWFFKQIPLPKIDQKKDDKVIGLFTPAMFLVLLLLAPTQIFGEVLSDQHDLPRPAPSPEISQVDPLNTIFANHHLLRIKHPLLLRGTQTPWDFFWIRIDKDLG